MRQITIDFNTSLIEAGYLGEHNATELVVVKPADVIGEMYSVAFMTNGEVIHSKYYYDNEEICVPLWQQLTQDYELGVQLEAYDEKGDYLGKSAMITLLFGSSAHGTDVVADAENPDVYSEIALNTWFRETLEDNADTLDKLTTSKDGILLFNGEEIKGGGGADGVSPIIDITEIEGGHRVTITDVDGTESFDVFDGIDGQDGANGLSAYQIWLNEGNTGIEADFLDSLKGEKGDSGVDGTSVTVASISESTEDGGSNVVTFSDGKTLTVNNGSTGSTGPAGKDGYTPIKGVDYFDGLKGDPFTYDDFTPEQLEALKGKDGVSATHSWDGTTLTITSASGTSSANLKGETGASGSNGRDGSNGADGYTPVKGIDYFTDEDKKELTAELSQIEAPKIVSSVDEMTDTTKHYVLDGNIWAYRTTTTEGETVLVPNFTNLIKFDANGNPTNVQLNKRYSASAGESVGYITNETGSFAITDAFDISGTPTVYISKKPTGQTRFGFFDENGTTLHSDGVNTIASSAWTNGSNGEFVGVPSFAITAPKMKFATNISSSAITESSLKDLIVTINEPITYTEQKTEGVTVSEWYDTGISYAPTFKTDLIGVLGENNVVYLSDNLPSGTYTLKYGDETYETVGTITVE